MVCNVLAVRPARSCGEVGCSGGFGGTFVFMLTFDERLLLVRSDAKTQKQSPDEQTKVAYVRQAA